MIGILTFHRAVNYGAVLQTYGLQKTLDDLEITSEVIDYRSSVIENPYKSFTIRSLKTFEFYNRFLKQSRFKSFIKNRINMTEPLWNRDQLGKVEDDYSAIITGSDQVWCKKCAKEEKTYFLDFVKSPSKKKSYAASIGNADISGELKKEYGKLLEGYDQISFREESACGLLADELQGKEVQVNIDPTLLLNSEKWDKVRNKNVEKSPYILVYTVLGQYNLFDEAHKLAEKTGLPIIYLNDEIHGREKGVIYRSAVSPEQFVGYFAEAKYVLTNSFHGTAFSIIYKKQFLVEIEAKGRRNIRSEELLMKLGLSNRFLTSSSWKHIDNAIDWNGVEEKLDLERKKSKEYLKKICF
ncbi:MAG: polysaccharide pyruvyl transferase family protein [Butyrivibrio sp.]|nr:polysaccharide pyruvyl transferase family protein [Butyrivibrio sp.]